jgi:hypothetical protein
MNSTLIVSALVVMGVALSIWGCKTSRSGYESAPYSAVLSDGKYELRDYPELTIVETTMPQEGGGENSGFGKLFRYITGNNKGKESIAMTTPVFISRISTPWHLSCQLSPLLTAPLHLWTPC